MTESDGCGCGGAGADGPPGLTDSHDGTNVAQLSVPEMDCPSCAGKVESSVRELAGIEAVDPQVATGRLTVEYDEAETDVDAIAARVEAAGYTVADDGGETLRFSVPEMDCASCAGKVESALGKVDGLRAVETRPTTGTAVVTYDRNATTEGDIVAAIESAGYEVTETTGEHETATGQTDENGSLWTSSRALKTWVSGVFVAFGLLFEFLLPGANAQVGSVFGSALHVADSLFLIGVATGGQEILRGGYYSLKNRNLDIDLLMSIAILGALTASLAFGEALYFEAATLAFLFSVAELLERYSMDRARNSLEELMDLSPDEATVKRDGAEAVVPVEDVQVGDVVVIRPGEKIPMDGEVTDGTSAVNQAPITGESVPVDKTEGDEVYAGTINEEGYLEVRVTAAASDNTLSRIVQMVEDAQSNKTEREQFVER
ncbi:MAG: copper ion binding protein, partial [Haloarcula sp.]